MPTPSSSSAAPRERKDLRDRLPGRLLILAVVLAVAVVSARACGGGEDALTRDEAIETARAVLVFEPDGVQVRYVNQGLPPRGMWIVSFHNGPATEPTAVQTVLVDAESGDITDDGTP